MISLFSSSIFWICIAVALLVVVVFISYVKAPPSNAYIISGLSKEPRVLIGSGGFRIPFFERLDKLYLGQMTVDMDMTLDACAEVDRKSTRLNSSH